MTAICSKCGRDCVTKLALGKHEGKCEGGPSVTILDQDTLDKRAAGIFAYAFPTPLYHFSDRHQTKTEKCPHCNEIWADFLILEETTWICLQCGCHFTPREKLNQINEWKLADAERKRTGS